MNLRGRRRKGTTTTDTTTTTERALLSCDPESEAYALAELRDYYPGLPVEWLDAGLALAVPPDGFTAFATVTADALPFVRHIAPVQTTLPLTATPDDLPALRDAALALADRLDPAAHFSVQSHILADGRLPYRRVTVNETLSDALSAATGAVMECRNPAQVLTVLCTPTRGYLGISPTVLNRSAWFGGMQRFREEEGQISRAEFKLLEAWTLFPVPLASGGLALDMGAAPGGWTSVLRLKGLRVVAVDPAELDRRLRGDGGIQHLRRRVEEYLPIAPAFAVIVNDMRMDIAESVRLMCAAAEHLRAGGSGVITLKLPRSGTNVAEVLESVRGAVARLAEKYRVVGVRQLYHNRSEVTVVLASRQSP